MIQSQLDRAVAGATGESLRTIRALGFTILARGEFGREAEDLGLRVDCPFCGDAVPYPGRARDRTPALAECPRCDLDFDFAIEEVYATGCGGGGRTSPER
jgi:hypothetical protein